MALLPDQDSGCRPPCSSTLTALESTLQSIKHFLLARSSYIICKAQCKIRMQALLQMTKNFKMAAEEH